jgi:aspartate aminotransferase
MSRISRRVAAIEESATLAISARAAKLKAEGVPVIGFGVGEPDFPTSEHVVEAAQRACAEPRFHKYTATAGLPELREAVAATTATHSGLVVEPSQVLITNGGKQAVFQAFAALLDPGDEVLLPAPYWVTYPEAIALAGGTTVAIPTGAAAGYRVTVEQLEAAATDRTKAVVFVSPSNPTGAVYPPDEVADIGRWAAQRGIWVVTDEIYDHLVFGAARFSSIPVEVPETFDRCVVINGVAKTYAMTGWRVGWMLGPKDVIAAATNMQSHATSNVANVSQAAALAALTGPQDEVEAMRRTFDSRRRLAHAALAAIPGVACPEPEGAFYVFPSVEGLLAGDRGTGDFGGRRAGSSMELCEILLDDAAAAVVPGEAFGAPGHFRLSYALGDEELELGLARIAAVLAPTRMGAGR